MEKLKVKDVLDYVLEDDGTPYGGVAFYGETLEDFIMSVNDGEIDLEEDVDVINDVLMDCGIKPIKSKVEN